MPLDGSTVLYVEGIEAARSTTGLKPSELYDANKDYSGYIGKSQYWAAPYFAAEVDDVRITATDGPDTFRIKIWKTSGGQVVHDNSAATMVRGIVTIGVRHR